MSNEPKRGDPRPWRHLYKRKAWYRLRHHQLQNEPLCQFCKKAGRSVAAQIVDHIVPHKGDDELFHDPHNLQSLCKTCHDSAKQRAERNMVAEIGCGIDGWPNDSGHHWGGGRSNPPNQ